MVYVFTLGFPVWRPSLPWNGARPLMCLVRLLHVDELFLQTTVFRQKLFKLGGVVLEVTWVSGVEVTARATLSSGSLSPVEEE